MSYVYNTTRMVKVDVDIKQLVDISDVISEEEYKLALEQFSKEELVQFLIKDKPNSDSELEMDDTDEDDYEDDEPGNLEEGIPDGFWRINK